MPTELPEHYHDTGFINGVADWLGAFAPQFDLYASAAKLHQMCLEAIAQYDPDEMECYAYLAARDHAIDRCYESDAWHVLSNAPSSPR